MPTGAQRPRGRPGHRGEDLCCRVVAVEQATHDIRIIALAPEGDARLAYAPGQYVRVAFAGQPERDFSLASRPSDAWLRLHIRNMQSGPSLHVSTGIAVGDRVRVRGPFGDTYLRREHPGAIVAVAGGSGLAPIKAIVEEALAQGLEQPIHLYFGAREERDIYLERHFQELARAHANLRYVPVLSEPEAPTPRRTGLVTEAVAADFADLSGAVAYLAGPPPMVEAAGDVLRRLGVGDADIHADSFIGEAERRRLEGER